MPDAYHKKSASAMVLREAQKTEEIVREEYEKQLKEQRQKFDQELELKLKEAKETIEESLNYEDVLSYFENEFEKAQKIHTRLLAKITSHHLLIGFMVYSRHCRCNLLLGEILSLGKESTATPWSNHTFCHHSYADSASYPIWAERAARQGHKDQYAGIARGYTDQADTDSFVRNATHGIRMRLYSSSLIITLKAECRH